MSQIELHIFIGRGALWKIEVLIYRSEIGITHYVTQSVAGICRKICLITKFNLKYFQWVSLKCH